MSLESILEKIGREAQAEREKIIRQSRDTAERLKEEAKQEAEEQAERLLEESGREAELDAHRLVSQARLQKKLGLLTLKKGLVDDVLDQAFSLLDSSAVSLKRRIVLKEGVREEAMDRDALKEELRPRLEGFIAGLLKL